MRTMSLPGGRARSRAGRRHLDDGRQAADAPPTIAALHIGVDLGMTVVDTAEMYGGGAAEELVAEALGARRSEIFLVSKVMPQHAARRARSRPARRAFGV